MVLIEWRDEFKLGIEAIDHEHYELIELINSTYQHFAGNAPAATVSDGLGEIYAKISAHFALEEKIMRDYHYDQYAEHKTDHEHLLDEIRDIMDDFELSESFDEASFGQLLADWFSEHFKTKDARLHQRLGV